MELNRGDIVTVVLSRDYGKPRPAVVVQSDALQRLDSVIVVPLTTHLLEPTVSFRPRIAATKANGLVAVSEVMVDKISAIPRERATQKIGRLTPDQMGSITVCIALLLGM